LALVLWCRQSADGDELVSMERFVRDIAESIGAQQSSLFIPVDRVTAWAWVPLPPDAASNAVERVRTLTAKDGPCVAVGNPLPGVEGFRRSHQQAQAARTVATASGTTDRQFIAACDRGVSVAALLVSDVEAASAWMRDVLGPLGSATDSDERLRETLRAFLGAGSSYKAAAEELHLHTNTVKYRVQRAIERRGRPIDDDRLDVENALLLCHWFGAAFIRPGRRPPADA
jgi:DNA-binding PucR family transcriptional regulator